MTQLVSFKNFAAKLSALKAKKGNKKSRHAGLKKMNNEISL
jgi:hypothetical protein